MAKFIARRLLWMLVVLFAVATITFILMHLVPGGPWDRAKALAPQVIENLNEKYGLDKPLIVQFGTYIWNALHGNLGVSYIFQDRGVTDIILGGLPVSAALGLTAFALAIIMGITLGVAAALKQNSWIDYFSVGYATIFASVPGFVLGIFLMYLLSIQLHWLPTGGWGGVNHVIMPAIALAALPGAYIARITRASMLDVIRQDYVRTARAKGLPERWVLIRHIGRNAMIPVVTVAGPELAALITGSFIIETLFSVPGIGRLFVAGVFQRDYGLIMGSILFYAFAVAIVNLAADVIYAAIDPRIRYD
ncbi:oligopeptide transport system permease protein [Dehalogenimonas formicexedens]|uniref:Oligopeptide transport system permease protein n=1 Tax=Dehalogenimonas formicexedens TaxID=1839801 RepID=A0A1P8F802_9CHLR|nr:ABC transporter permease [Dehalogenimonas formicexedens]APV44563.1 oligopeptide transport system permease protein [Dehalogenimonas formicexedens]